MGIKDQSQSPGIRKFLQGFIIGVLVTAMLAAGFVIVKKPDFLQKSDTTNTTENVLGKSGPLLQTVEQVTIQDFDTKILKSKNQELVFIADPNEKSVSLGNLSETINMVRQGGFKNFYVTDNADRDYMQQFGINIYDGPMFALFYNEKMISQMSVYAQVNDFIYWMNHNKPYTPPDNITPSPTPEPEKLPVFYRAFPRTMFADLENSQSDYFISEICLFPVNYEYKNFMLTGKGKTLPFRSNTALYSLIGYSFGGSGENIGLPDLTVQSPLNGLNYQINIDSGVFPSRGRVDLLRTHVDRDIKYLEIPIKEMNPNTILGEIVLAKNIDESALVSKMVPCDGRELSMSLDVRLYSIMENKFGGDNVKTFRIPDLSKVTSPVEGAKYYIITAGNFPERK